MIDDVRYYDLHEQTQHALNTKKIGRQRYTISRQRKFKMILEVLQTLTNVSIVSALVFVGGLLVVDLLTRRRPAPPKESKAIKPEAVVIEPVIEVIEVTEPEIETAEIEPEFQEPVTTLEEIIAEQIRFFEAMTLRQLREVNKGRVKGIRSLSKAEFAQRLALATAQELV